ncbi:MAG TPA: arginase family protein [Mycobacteriales bacterium]|nr:arginase family protein [Mycobacteriales bacterium]
MSDPRWPTAADWLAAGTHGEAGTTPVTTDTVGGIRAPGPAAAGGAPDGESTGAGPGAPGVTAGGASDGASTGAGPRVDLAVLGIGTWRTSVSPTGAQATPAAVRLALARYSTYAASLEIDLADRLVAVDLGDVDDPDADEDRAAAAVRAATLRARLTVVLGGDNAATVPAVRGAGATGLVTLDAHHDLRDGRSNGSPVRRLLEQGLAGSRVAQVGIADWANSAAYAAAAARAGITVIPRPAVAERGVEDCVRSALDVAASAGGPVHVDLDVDVCDRAVAPGCPASRPGGLSAAELLTAARIVGADPRVGSVDLSEVDSTRDASDQRTVRLAALAVLELAAGLAIRREHRLPPDLTDRSRQSR